MRNAAQRCDRSALSLKAAAKQALAGYRDAAAKIRRTVV
jgi:hypothetical protein